MKNKNHKWCEVGIDSSVFILIQGTNHQQLKWAGARFKAYKSRFFNSHVAERWNRGCFECQGLICVQELVEQVHRREMCKGLLNTWQPHLPQADCDLQMLEDGRL